MSAFFISLIPETTDQYISKLTSVIEARGFKSPKKFSFGKYSFHWFPGLGGQREDYWQDEAGNLLIILGTCIYRTNLVGRGNWNLFNDIIEGNIQAGDLRGTFCIFAFNASNEGIHIVHDSKGMYRLYFDNRTNTISSSFSALFKAADTNKINKHIVRFNLVFGYNPASYTWDDNIVRILKEDQIPEGIHYTKAPDSSADYSFRSFNEGIEQAASLLQQKLNFNTGLQAPDRFLGLSSGYDSRLMAAALIKNQSEDLQFFTFNKPGASDPVIARRIADICGKQLLRKETSRPSTYEEQERVYRNGYNFFDGQAVTMMQYSKPDYSAEFRNDILGNNALHFSGVGGELFRNYNYDHQQTCSVNDWLIAYLLGGNKLDDFIDGSGISDLLLIFYSYLESELSVNDTINYTQRKKYYGDLFLRDWHSVRNSVENQYSYYYTPFSDQELINLSYATAKYHGVGGKFEGSMIGHLSPELAALPSGYGFPLNNYPAKAAMVDWLRATLKRPLFTRYRRSVKTAKPYQPTAFEIEQLKIFSTLDPEINIKGILSSSKRVEPLLSTAYSLKQLVNL